MLTAPSQLQVDTTPQNGWTAIDDTVSGILRIERSFPMMRARNTSNA